MSALLHFAAFLAVIGSAAWLYSDLKNRRLRKGWAAGISLVLMAGAYYVTTAVAGLVLGTTGVLATLTPLIGGGVTVLFCTAFAVPVSRQLRSGPPPS